MIYLNAEVVSGLGEDTFWTWFKREFLTSSFASPRLLRNEDIILRYSTLGFANRAGKSIALLWELYPEMKTRLKSDQWNSRLAPIYECARFSTYRLVASRLMVPYYEQFGTIDVLPIGVDTELSRPLGDKSILRKKYGIPEDRTVGFWCGTTHPMKGFDTLLHYAKENPEIYWIIVWKQPSEAGQLRGTSNFVKVSQDVLSELMNGADFCLSPGRLGPFSMVEREAMACNLEMRILGEVERDFMPSGRPREDVFQLEWHRGSVKKARMDSPVSHGSWPCGGCLRGQGI